MADTRKEQIEIAERLQLKWLKWMEAAIDANTITSTDLATLRKFLQDNGWNIDPARVPESLKDKLTAAVRFDEDEEDDFPPLKVAR